MARGYLRANAFVIVVTAVVVLAGYRAVVSAERYFSSASFCVSCHSMTYPYEGLKRSAHWGPRGINPGCGDCHFPPRFIGKIKVHITAGIRDTVSQIRLELGTKEAFDRHKKEFAEKARETLRSWDSSPCRACHKDPKPRSDFGRAAHERLSKGGVTCVDCHQGIFHEPAAG